MTTGQTRSNRPSPLGCARLLLASMVMLATLVVAAPADAAPGSMSSEDFAKHCNLNRYVHLDSSLLVSGGHGHLTADCWVVLDPEVELTFKRAHLTGTRQLAIEGDDKSTINVISSSLEFERDLYLFAGTRSGESNGRLGIEDSYLRGHAVLLEASTRGDGGRVVVHYSKIEAVGSSPLLRIEASDRRTKLDGSVVVTNSALITPGDASVATGERGNTIFEKNDVDRVAGLMEVSTGPGGACSASRNTRHVVCS